MIKCESGCGCFLLEISLHIIHGKTCIILSKIKCESSYFLLDISLGIAWVQSSIFSNANILINKRIKLYHIKGIGCPLLISINIDAWGHP